MIYIRLMIEWMRYNLDCIEVMCDGLEDPELSPTLLEPWY